MTTDGTERKLAGPGQTERLKEIAVRIVNGADHLVSRLHERIAKIFGEGTSADFFREVSETVQRERAAAERARTEECAEDVVEEAASPVMQLPAVVSQAAPAEQTIGPRLTLPYFGIEHFKPSQIAQLFANGVEPQPFDPKLSYRIRSYAPPEGTVLHFVFERINKALGQGQQPVRLLLLQPVKTAGGEEVPIVQSKALITSVCVYLSKETPWMEIRPMGPRIHEAGVDLKLGQPAVIKIKPPDLERGFFEPYVVFLHDRRRPVRLGALLEKDYMDGKSSICPLSEIAKNYFEAQKLPLLARLPEPEPMDGARPPVYEPFPVKAQPQPRPRRMKAVVMPNYEPAALPAPKPEEKGRKPRRRKPAPPPVELTATVVSAEHEETHTVPPVTH